MGNDTERQLLRDPDIRPTGDVLAAALKDSFQAYAGFVDMLPNLDIQPEWRYYNDGKAWLCKGAYKRKTSRGTDKERTVFWLSVWDGFFRVSFFIGEKQRAYAQNIFISQSTKDLIADAKTVGKLKFFPVIFDVRTNDPFGDLCALINFQKSVK